MTANDVTNVEFSRMLKRNGAPQETQAYWQGIMPSLTTIQGMGAIAQEDKGKMRWLLILGKPPEPNASAFTYEELETYLKKYMEEKVDTQKLEPLKKREFPIITQDPTSKTFYCTIGKSRMFNSPKKADSMAQAVLYITKL